MNELPLLPHPRDRRPSIRQQQDAAQPLLPLIPRDSRPPRNSSRSLFQSPLTDRLTVSHLRRSDLAGWRTRSLFPIRDLETSHHDAPLQSFLPVLKLRGLPYFCSKRHVLMWFGELAPHVVDLFFVAEVEPLNTGFAIVTLDSAATALAAWRTLHKKPIVGKRFVEVFGLFPPQCPLSRRDSVSGKQGLIPLPPGLEPVTSPDTVVAACPFCGLALAVHSDGGLAALATARMRECVERGALAGQRAEALMHTAFLSVPALLYQDAGAVSRSEVELFDPDSQPGRGFIEKFAETREVSLPELEHAVGLPPSSSNPVLFFDLTGIQGFDMRALLFEIVRLLYDQPAKSIAEIGNHLSTRARAYLFLTELKLRNVVESFPEIFGIIKPSVAHSSYTVGLRGETKREGVNAVRRMEPFQLTKRRRNRGNEVSNRTRQNDWSLYPLPLLERHSTQQPEGPGDIPPSLVALQRSQTSHRRESAVDHPLPRLRPLTMNNRAASYAYSGGTGPSQPHGQWLPPEDEEGCMGAFAANNEYPASNDNRSRPSRQEKSYNSLRRHPTVPEPTNEIGAALTDLIRTLSMDQDESGGPPSAQQANGTVGWTSWATPPLNKYEGNELYRPTTERLGGWPQPVHVQEVPPMWAPRGTGSVDQSEQVLLESLKEKQHEIIAIQRALAEHRNQISPPPYIASGWGVGLTNSPPKEENTPLGEFATAESEQLDINTEDPGQNLLANLAELLQSLASTDTVPAHRMVEGTLTTD